MTRVFTTDLQALNYVLNSPEFDKPIEGRELMRGLTGEGWHNFLDVVTI
jgi:hypothetical protein